MIENSPKETFASNGRGKVWLENKDKGWIQGEIVKQLEDSSYLVLDQDGKETTIKNDDVRMQNPSIQEGIDDMTCLSHLHEAAVIHNLIKRYELNEIYTYTGTILIAINPYSKLPIYTREMIESFCDQPVAKLPPHVYSIAENAYREMLNFQKNQSILVSGESGAGKTETTKFLLQYFAAMGEKGNGNTVLASESDIEESNNIETQVIKSTPILEAFGNSKTLRNDNSSRFGKFIEIHFDKQKGTIVGAKLETYLLEKSRIVKPPANERSYHIFYQMLAGLDEKVLEGLSVSSDPLEFNYLSQSGCHTIDDVDDKDIFMKTEKALRVVGFTEDELLGVYKMLASILHLGNIEFGEGKEEGSSVVNDLSTIGNKEYNPLETACTLLGCDKEVLKKTFTSRMMKAGNESYTIPLNTQQASEARDSLSMFLYSRLFDWLVYRINLSIFKNKKDYLFIGILDIYGFESFEKNSFEQFTINYANEKLQNQFNHQIFKLEQIEYDKEKIDWSYIEFSDNQDCIDLIEKKPLGILSILDEESQFPKSTPNTLCSKLYSNHSKTKHFEKPRFGTTSFTIDHYAGKVNYDTELFLDKNKDFIIAEQVIALEASSWEFFTKLLKASKMGGAPESKQAPSSSGGKGKAAGSTFKFSSVSQQFKESLNQLMNTINSTNPHYIRCIKPNTEKKANLFDNLMVLHQLRCSGVIEQLRISRSGYPSRLPYESFIKRYKLIVSKDFKESSQWQDIVKDEKKGSEKMVEKLNIDLSMVQFGLTKVFFKSGVVANLELLRSETMYKAAIDIQRMWRGFFEKKKYMATKQSSICLQSFIRAMSAQGIYNDLLLESSALHLQSVIRHAIEERYMNHLRHNSLHFQTLIRSYNESQEFYAFMEKSRNIITIQSRWRGRQARRVFKQMKIYAKSLTNVVAEKSKLESRIGEFQSRLSEQTNTLSMAKKEKQDTLDKLSSLEKEYDQFKIESKSIIDKLSQENATLLDEIDQLKATILNNDGNPQSTTPPQKSNSPVLPSSSSSIIIEKDNIIRKLQQQLEQLQQDNISKEQEQMEDIDIHDQQEELPIANPNILLSPKKHKGEDRDDQKQISKSIEHIAHHESSGNNDVQVPRETIELIEITKQELSMVKKENQQLLDKESTNQRYIQSLKDQIKQLEDRLVVEGKRVQPRVLPGVSSELINSPINNRDVKHLSYVDFIKDSENDNSLISNSSPMSSSTGMGSPSSQSELGKSRSIESHHGSIQELASSVKFNNNPIEAGKYLVDLIMLNRNQLTYITSSSMGGLPEPAFIVSRCFIQNIYLQELTTSPTTKSFVEQNVEVMLYFFDKIDDLILKDPKANNTTLSYWFSNFFVIYNIVEAFQGLYQSSISNFSDQDKALLDKFNTTLQVMIVKSHKSVVKHITDYIQPLLHKSLNVEPTLDINFYEPITNYLSQIELSLSLDHCLINENICKLLFEQIFSFINATVFNEILLRKDLCCTTSSIPLKVNISELEHWVKSHHDREWATPVLSKLRLLKEVFYILMIDKTQLSNQEMRQEICPTLSVAQLKQLLTMYTPDVDSFEAPIPLEILTSLMESSQYNRNENVLLELSKIFTLSFQPVQTSPNSSPIHSISNLKTSIDLNQIQTIHYQCDSLVSSIMKKNIEISKSGKK
ncbi:hypothetical protein CYY_006967 [Polysphondylium violaceum]|uniref:Uncharacterized protein n=1 Tax=Polysphondylium violaceum TaxID=133409 RepID=A0A8J4PR44_9MYCE|nr:hypothetical protein CYY_006967 [Polysphondylium violaceum]